MKFVSHPRELCFNLLPGKVTNVSVGENTCAAVTGKLAVTKILHAAAVQYLIILFLSRIRKVATKKRFDCHMCLER